MRRTVFWKFVAGRQLAPRMGYFRDQGVVMLNLRGSGGLPQAAQRLLCVGANHRLKLTGPPLAFLLLRPKVITHVSTGRGQN
jgi:hypothetical protein